jgi:undecaprenyl-diphosphatase
MQLVTEIGDVYYMLIFGIILVITKRTRRIGVTLMILLVMATLLTGYIKCGIDRERPNLLFEGVSFPIPLEADTFSLFCEGGYMASFPSGHVARAAVFGVVLGFSLSERFPRGCYLLLIYPLLMSISRVYVLQHYPMDVIGGVLIGILLAGAVSQKTKLYKILKSEP